MADLFKKLTTLIRANLNDLRPQKDDTRDPAPRIAQQLDREVAVLRDKVNRALDQETALQARTSKLMAEIEELDRAADVALQQGNDAAARKAVEQMQRAQQYLAIAEADLREHRRVTEELIQNVNRLEAVLGDARAKQRDEAEASAQSAENLAERLLREARETLNRMTDTINTTLSGQKVPTAPAESTQPQPPVQTEAEQSPPQAAKDAQPPKPSSGETASSPAVEDDLERRRRRLSKPDS